MFLALKFLWAHHLFQVGKDVILFAILRSELAVARGTVISTDPNTMVGGQPLGMLCCLGLMARCKLWLVLSR